MSRPSRSNNGLAGTLPAAIGENMTALRSLHLRHNHISGTLPEEWGGRMSRLQVLLLSDNHLSGTLPDGYGALMVSLERLRRRQPSVTRRRSNPAAGR